MMLKLQGHPPMLMRRDGKEEKLSSRLASVVDRCVDPKPSNRSSAHRLLSLSFFKVFVTLFTEYPPNPPTHTHINLIIQIFKGDTFILHYTESSEFAVRPLEWYQVEILKLFRQ